MSDQPDFSTREQQVLDLLCEGQSNKGIAHELGISVRTVEIHRKSALTKLGVTTGIAAVALLYRRRIADLKAELAAVQARFDQVAGASS